jgi:peptide/nickel transport system permease protein
MTEGIPGRGVSVVAMRKCGLGAILLWLVLGFFWTPHDPQAQSFRENALGGPSWSHWLGVDGLGRDFLSRLWEGSAHTALYSTGALFLTLFLAAGLLAIERRWPAYAGKAIRSMVGIWVAVPVVFLGLLLLVFLRPSASSLVLAVGLGNVPFAFRQLRVAWLTVRGALYVQASEVLGARGWPLLRRAIWPNLVPEVVALSRLLLAMSVLELSGLAFLGLMGDPDTTELGSILRQNQAYLYQAPFLVIFPGLLLSSLLLLLHLSGQHGSTQQRKARSPRLAEAA